MRREPALTFRGALSMLGRSEPRLIERLDSAIGGVVLADGPTAQVLPGMGFAPVWGWLENNGPAVELLKQTVAKVSRKLPGTTGYERWQMIAAVHSASVVAAFFDGLGVEVGNATLRSLIVSRASLAEQVSRSHQEKLYQFLYDAELPPPFTAHGFGESERTVRAWIEELWLELTDYVEANRTAHEGAVEYDWDRLRDEMVEQYRLDFMKLASTIPEFAIWAQLSEYPSTGVVSAQPNEGVRRALAASEGALSRIEALLSLDAPPVKEIRGLGAVLARVNRHILAEPVILADDQGFGPDITVPTVTDGYINPRYQVVQAEGAARLSEDEWWRERLHRDDFDLMFTGYVTSPDATRLPMLLLGHPGAGKSMLMKVLASRLPTSAYTVVRVPLRQVGATAPLINQVENMLELATNGRVGWTELAEQSKDTIRVVLLDGLDELLQASEYDRSSYLQEVVEFQRIEAEQQRPVVVVVTSRVIMADRIDIPHGATVVRLGEFNDDDIADWLDRWRRVNADAISAGRIRELTLNAVGNQRELARLPLLLLMLVLYEADPAVPSLDSSTATAELYRLLIERFAYREATRDYEHQNEVKQRVQDHIERLEIAAFAMFNRGRQEISEEEIGSDLEALEPRLMERTRPIEAGQRVIGEFFFVHAPETILLAAASGASTAGTSMHRLRRTYEFLHPTFGEYLVANRVIREVAELAASVFARRRGMAEPDDNLLYALLSHQPLVARWSTLSFAKELFDGLPIQEREQVQEVLRILLATYRNRHSSARYAAYRPVPDDQVSQLICYSANLTVLRVLFESDESTLLDELLRASNEVLQQWQSTVTFATGMTELRSVARPAPHTNERAYNTPTEQADRAGSAPIEPPEVDANLVLSVYIPAERLYAAETRRLLELFHDWMTSTRQHGIRQSRYRTASGEMFEFYADSETTLPNLREKFDIFSVFFELCANSPTAAINSLNKADIGQAAGSEMVARYGKEYRRLQVDLRQEWERRIMTLRHTLEGELLEMDIDLRQVSAVQIDLLLEKWVPGPSVQPSLPVLAELPTPYPMPPVNVTVNQNIISAMETTVVQNVQGDVYLGNNVRDVLAMIGRLGGQETMALRSAVHTLEDPEIPAPRKSAAKAKLKSFLSYLGTKAQDSAFAILEKYLESKLGL
jgi:ATPase family associated with various cellular activities (AAA)